jgi:hypothetical protein
MGRAQKWPTLYGARLSQNGPVCDFTAIPDDDRKRQLSTEQDIRV